MKRNINIEKTTLLDTPQDLLDLHLQWRNQGIPMLSVLSGSWNDAQKIWNQWIQDNEKITAIWSSEISKPLLIIWLEALLAKPNLQYQLLSFLAETSQCSAEEMHSVLINKSKYELIIVQEQLPVKISTQGLCLLHWFLNQISMSRQLTPSSSLELAAMINSDGNQGLARGVMTLTEFLPMSFLPGLLMQVSDEELSTSPLIRTMLQLAEYLPSIPLAVSVTPQILMNYYTKAPDSKIKAMLRNGMVEVYSDQNSQFTLPHEVECILRKYDASTQLIEEAKSLHKLTAARGDNKLFARSQAELFLFHVLELIPETRGLFELNARMIFPFENKPMEIDLFAINEKIALEIDGYYHFRELDDWRRDRRKDFSLQINGILILRFLAEDVVTRLEEILNVVRQALDYRGQ